MKKILFLCMPFFYLTSTAQTVNIPDKEFLKDLIRLGIDKNKDGYIQYTEADSIEKIVLQRNTISNLAGIEVFKSLKYLSCGNLKITKLDVSKNISLEVLFCNFNQLSTLDISKNISLVTLVCGYNPINKLDVSQNLALKELYCQGNQLTTLNVSSNKALGMLSCEKNKLTSLNVTNNLALDNLYCDNNSITSLDLSNNRALKGLSCTNNRLEVLNVSNNILLTSLFCHNNLLKILDLSKNIKLNNLICNDNLIKWIDLSDSVSLYSLYIYNNDLSNLDISKISTIDMHCGGNPKLFSICINVNQVSQTKPYYDQETRSEVFRWLKDAQATWEVNCGSVSVQNMRLSTSETKLIGIYNVLGQEVSLEQVREGVYIYRYSDGSVKRIWNNNSN